MKLTALPQFASDVNRFREIVSIVTKWGISGANCSKINLKLNGLKFLNRN